MQVALFAGIMIISIVYYIIQAQSFLSKNTENYNVAFIGLIMVVLLIGPICSSMLTNYLSDHLVKLSPEYAHSTSNKNFTQYLNKLDMVASCAIFQNEALNIMNVNVTARPPFPVSEMYIVWSDQDEESHARAMFKRDEEIWGHILSTRIDSKLTGFIIACAEDGQIAATTFDTSDM